MSARLMMRSSLIVALTFTSTVTCASVSAVMRPSTFSPPLRIMVSPEAMAARPSRKAQERARNLGIGMRDNTDASETIWKTESSVINGIEMRSEWVTAFC